MFATAEGELDLQKPTQRHNTAAAAAAAAAQQIWPH